MASTSCPTPPSSSDTPLSSHVLLPDEPRFYEDLHVAYITSLAQRLDEPTSYEGALTEHLKMSGVYWSLTALHLLRPSDQVDQLLGATTKRVAPAAHKLSILDWLFDCFDPKSGGFGGNVGHPAHLLYTLSALQILALADALQDDRLQRERITDFIVQLQQPNGSFTGDSWGEVDTRFTYCALSSLALLQALDRARVRDAALYVRKCQNLDGGFGAVVGGESHAGQVFCCVGALAIAQSLDLIMERDSSLAWWLAERQVDSGGLNGRPEKQADVCYSWWIVSSLAILGKLSWIQQDRLAAFILQCQDGDDGGIADRPDDMADVFHTFFGVAGLSLLGHLHSNVDSSSSCFRSIDPVYALPTDVVQSLRLPGQVMAERGQAVQERLAQYNVCYSENQNKSKLQ
jgi:geranylgeranyl transferase type-2 subunit beta